MSKGGGYESAVVARTRCWWVKFGECGELLYGMEFPLRLKRAVCWSYVRPVILHGSESWCLNESEMRILRMTERSMVRAMCGVQHLDRKRSMDLNETMDQLAMANDVSWYAYVLRREDGHVLRMALDFVVEGQRKKGRLKRTWRKQVEEESVKVGLRREDALFRSKLSVDFNQTAAGLR